MGHPRVKKPKKTAEVNAPILEAAEIKTALPKEIPHLEAYVKEVFYSFNYQSLIIDGLFILFSFLISGQFFSEGGLFDSLKKWQILAMYCAVAITMPYYLGYIYSRNSAYFSKSALKLQLWIFIIITLVVLINLMRLVFELGDVENVGNDENGFFAVFAVFMLVLGPMTSIAGSMQAYSEYTDEPEDDTKFNLESDRYGALAAFAILILAVAFMIYFIGLFGSKIGGWAAVLSMFGGCFAAVIVLGIFMSVMKFLSKIGVYKYIAITAKKSFPFFIVAILVFWSGVNLHFMHADFANSSGKVPAGAVFWTVISSGLIPFRLVMMFSPPWRLSNILLGLASMIWFFYSIAKVTC
jgi:hypothetical protein